MKKLIITTTIFITLLPSLFAAPHAIKKKIVALESQVCSLQQASKNIQIQNSHLKCELVTLQKSLQSCGSFHARKAIFTKIYNVKCALNSNQVKYQQICAKITQLQTKIAFLKRSLVPTKRYGKSKFFGKRRSSFRKFS